MNKIQKFIGDLWGLSQVCGWRVALKWWFAVFKNFPQVRKTGNLQSADQALGEGPFIVKLKQYGREFKVSGQQIVSGIREMYVRDVYLRRGWLTIKDGDTVVDLGANVGNFSNLALSFGPDVRVIAVEPNQYMNDAFYQSLGNNPGFLSRTTLVRAFLGEQQNHSLSLLEQSDCSNAPWMGEDELIKFAAIASIDLLKCDIEGGEYMLLNPASKLLAMTQSLTMELHAFAGDVNKFLADLTVCGFTLGPMQRDPDGTVTLAAKRIP